MGALTAAALGILAALPSAFPQSLNASFEGGNSASVPTAHLPCLRCCQPTCCAAAALPCGLRNARK